MSNKNLLMIFTKNPIEGQVKTRLAKDLGDRKALEIYIHLLQHTREITSQVNSDKQVFYSNHILEEDLWEGKEYEKELQIEGDLGEKMEAAFKKGFDHKYQKIIVIGSDLYDIDSKDIEQAFKDLDDHDYVVGPAEDGGYYLLGMKEMNADLFQGIAWSTSGVFEATLHKMQDKEVKVLALRNDIDILNDIKDIPAFKKFID